MSSCFFIGHHDCPRSIEEKLKKTVINLITEQSVNTFYVGNHGNFDIMATDVLIQLREKYRFNFYIVLAYMPEKKRCDENTILPDNIEIVPKRFAIPYRNKWMISHSDYLICYVDSSLGNSHKYMTAAIKSGVRCFNIAQ